MVDKVIVPRRFEDWFELNRSGLSNEQRLEFTLRALKFFENLTNDTNTVIQEVDDTDSSISVNSKIFSIQQQIGSGLALTIDTTGFTVDTTKQFTDQTEV